MIKIPISKTVNFFPCRIINSRMRSNSTKRRQPISSKILKSNRTWFHSVRTRWTDETVKANDTVYPVHLPIGTLTAKRTTRARWQSIVHCMENAMNRRRSLEPAAAPFIYLTLSSFARTSVSSLLTHSMPETNECTMLKIRMFDRSSYPFFPPTQ